MYDMINIFESFLPQLLRYPNPSDPLNGDAAQILMRDQNAYNEKVKGTSTYTFLLFAVDGLLTIFTPFYRLCEEVCEQRRRRR